MLTTSLHGGRGGKATTVKRHMPSDAEALALMVGCAGMLWVLRRSADNPEFFTLVASEVKRIKATSPLWTRDEMVFFFHQKILGGIPQKGFKDEYMRRRRSILIAW